MTDAPAKKTINQRVDEAETALITETSDAVNAKGARGTVTRGLLAGISGFSKLGKIGNFLTKALGLKKILRKVTFGTSNSTPYGDANLTTLDLMLAQYDLRKTKQASAKHDKREASANPRYVPGSDNAHQMNIKGANARINSIAGKIAQAAIEKQVLKESGATPKAETPAASKTAAKPNVTNTMTQQPSMQNNAVAQNVPNNNQTTQQPVSNGNGAATNNNGAVQQSVPTLQTAVPLPPAPGIVAEAVVAPVVVAKQEEAPVVAETTVEVIAEVQPVAADIVAEEASVAAEQVFEMPPAGPVINTLQLVGRHTKDDQPFTMAFAEFETFLNEELKATPEERAARRQARAEAFDEKFSDMNTPEFTAEDHVEASFDARNIQMIDFISDHIDEVDEAYTTALGVYSGKIDPESADIKNAGLVKFLVGDLKYATKLENVQHSVCDIAVVLAEDHLRAERKLKKEAKASEAVDVKADVAEVAEAKVEEKPAFVVPSGVYVEGPNAHSNVLGIITIPQQHAHDPVVVASMEENLAAARRHALAYQVEENKAATSPAPALRYIGENEKSPTFDLPLNGNANDILASIEASRVKTPAVQKNVLN